MLQVPYWYAYIIFCILCCTYFLVSFQRLCLGIIASDIAVELGFGPVLLGWLGAGFHYSYALCQIPGGYIIDRYGPRVPLSLFFGLIGGIGSYAFACANSFGTSVVARILVGIGMSIVTASSLKTISYYFSSRKYMRLVSIFFAIGGVGMLFSAAPLAFLNKLYGWRSIFLVVSLITCVCGLGFWFMLKGLALKKDNRFITERYKKNLSFLLAVKTLFSSKHFLLILAWYITASSIFFSFASLWAGPYYMSTFDLSSNQVGSLLSFGIIGVIIGTPVGAWLSEKMDSRKKVITLASILALLGSALLYLITGTSEYFLPYISFALICLSGNIGVSVIYTLLKDSIPIQLIGTSTAIMSSTLFILTACLQMVIGYLLEFLSHGSDQLPYDKVFIIYGILAFLSLFLSLRLDEAPQHSQRIPGSSL